jgi:acyl-CoA reductase-like NAD-dependent aldehyde dehydrogenase
MAVDPIGQLGQLIDGKIVRGENFFAVENPGTGDIGAQCPQATIADLDAACAAATQAQAGWDGLGHAARREAIRAMGAVLLENVDTLNMLGEIEKGVPFGPAGLPVATGEAFLAKMFADHIADMPIPVDIIEDNDLRTVQLVRKPVGVVAAISSWNGPIFLAANKVFHALLVGNTVVAKPSPFAALTGLYLGMLWKDIVPPGVVNIVAGDDELGAALVGHPAVRLVSFTGGAAGGRSVAEVAARSLKNVVLELGGNDAAIVLPDVDVAAIAERVYHSSFVIAGQACLAIKRLFVHESIHDRMVEALAEFARKEIAGPAENGGTFPPLTTRPQYHRIQRLVEDALSKGAVAVTGGKPADGKGFFYPPTILTNVSRSMRIVEEEQFGPVLPVIAYTDVDAAIAEANDTEFGLCGSVWSADQGRAAELANRLEAGTVYVNSHGDIAPHITFGGVKASGIGKENGAPGLDAYSELQTQFVPK